MIAVESISTTNAVVISGSFVAAAIVAYLALWLVWRVDDDDGLVGAGFKYLVALAIWGAEGLLFWWGRSHFQIITQTIFG